MSGFLTLAGDFLFNSITLSVALLFGTLGAILNEKVGNTNLGVEGMMMLGACTGFGIALNTSNMFIIIPAAGLAGALAALLYAVITVTFKGNQTVTGLVLTIFGVGLANYIGLTYSLDPLPEKVKEIAGSGLDIPILSDIPIIGKGLFSHNFYVYMAFAAAIIIYLYFSKTQAGLNMRTVGENPGAADSAGINVDRYKYIHIVLGGFLCGLGGAYISVIYNKAWKSGITSGLGWIAVALVIFATWSPLKAILGSVFFGVLRALPPYIQNANMNIFGKDIKIDIPTAFLQMLPYLMTVVVLVLITVRKKREHQPPAHLGLPYFREDR